VPDPPPGDRGDAQHLLRGGGQPVDPGDEQLGQLVRHAVGAGRHEFLGEERVALAAPGGALHGRLGQRPVGQPADQLDRGRRVERPQLHPLHGR
jgi:hypothetical protein